MTSARPLLLLAAILSMGAVAYAAPLAKIENCTLIPTEWADGDSFRIQIPQKPADANGPGHKARIITIRLYGVDCLEHHVHNPTDSRRLWAQRRYFGISKLPDSIELAKKFGKLATQETRKILSRPFTVFTSFADGRGDPRHKRIYAFIVTADGKDLSELLVTKGLARAYGVTRETYDKRHQNEYKAHLTDLELRAARKAVGIWKHTDWDKLPEERRAQRDEEREIAEAINDGKKKQPNKKIPINTASRDELMQLPGVGETMANRIIQARPYKHAKDLLKVDGIGEKTLEKLKQHLVFPTP